MSNSGAKGRITRFGWFLSGAVPLALIAAAGCQQNTGKPPVISYVKPVANANVGFGFDPGVDLTGAGAMEAESGLVGAVIPGPTGGSDWRVSFFGFASNVSAATLDRDPTPPTDANGAADVFLSAVTDSRVTVNGEPQPAVFSQAMVNAFRHVRCFKCHGFHFPGGFGDVGTSHPGGESEQKNEICLNCHDVDIGVGEQGQPIEWRAPLLADQGEITFEGKTPFELCTQVKTEVADIPAHFGNDTRIFWAMEDAIVPTGEVAPGGPVPFRKAHFDELVSAWVQGGCQCTTAEGVKDVVLASRAAAGNAAANGASLRPSLAFVHNPAFDPDDLAMTNVAGWVYVAFESDATDLVAGFGNNNGGGTDVFRAQVEVRVDENPSGMIEAGAINLVALNGMTVLGSAASGVQGGNGASSRPALSGDGMLVAFESLSTDGANELVSGFVDVNGLSAPDVFVRNLGTLQNALVSRSFGTAGGNDASGRPSISAAGDAVAFESAADDFDFNDTNGFQDVFYARIDAATTTVLSLARASVATGGVQATGGDSRNASVATDPLTGEIRVVFESDKTDLVGTVAGLRTTNVYVHRGGAQSFTALLSQVSTAGSAELADGPSTAPSISPDGRWAAYQTTATNLDVVRPDDQNGVDDVVLVDLDLVFATGEVAGERLSVAAEGVDGAGSSTAPRLAGFVTALGDFDAESLATYTTLAQNLGISSAEDTGAPMTDRNLAILVD